LIKDLKQDQIYTGLNLLLSEPIKPPANREQKMHTVVTALETAARQLRLSGGLEQSQYSQIVAQLREVSDQLNALERRKAEEKASPVNFTDLVRHALRAGSVPAGQAARTAIVQVPEDVMVKGPAHDLRDTVCSLIEYVLTVARDPIKLHADIRYIGHQARAVCSTELTIQSPDVPDFLRQKLWEVVGRRRGEVSIVCAPECCRVVFTLPVERRLGIVLG
jgi:hypothetical protein